MNKLLIVICACVFMPSFAIISHAQTEPVQAGSIKVKGGSEHHLVVEIEGANPATGTVEISLFKNDEFFMKEAYLQNSGAVKETGTFMALFNKLDEGEYAVVVVHDANDNQKLDSGFLGFGGESYAYSNNAKPWFGRPDFEDIAVKVSGPTHISISLE